MTAARPLAFARYYARHAWPVFPLAPRTKIPIKDSHGFQDASTDLDTIIKWWETTPEAGIGIPTGRASGIVVIDVDPRHDGDKSLAKLEQEHGPLPQTVEAITGGGGRHLVFAYPAGDVEIGNKVKLAGLDGIDVRAEGGYIAVAPTIHPSGNPYRWKRNPKDTKPAQLPDWLLALLTGGGNGDGNGLIVRAGLDTGKILDGPPDGERDVDLWGLACKFRGADMPIEAAYEYVAKAARNAKPPVEDRVAFDKVKRAYAKYEAGKPRLRQEPIEPKELVPMTSADILAAARAPVEWAIRPLQTVKGINIIGAAGKTMKTTWTITGMVSLIHGGTLAGQFEVGRGHTIAWFDAENSPRSWSRKFGAVCAGLKVDPQDILDRGRFNYFNSRGLYLDDDSILKAVIDAARKVNASQIVLDSLTRIHRLKENDAVAMSSFFVDRIFRIRDEVIAGITILHHTRKGLQGYRDNADDALRGTGDLRNVVDSYISLSRGRKNKSLFTITVSAQRDAAEEGPFHVALDWPQDGPATFTRAEPDEADQAEPRPNGRPPTAHETAVRVLKDALAADPALSWTKAVRLCREHGVMQTTANRALRELKRD